MEGERERRESEKQGVEVVFRHSDTRQSGNKDPLDLSEKSYVQKRSFGKI